MSLEILKAGVLDTLQDTGRPGYRGWGIGPGGAMDAYAAQIANALVGNGPDAALMEVHFPAPHILMRRDVVVSITGAQMVPTVDGHEIPLWKPVIVKAGHVLSFQRRNKGARSYLAFRGGIDVLPWLGSRSTNLKIGAGGFQGRALRRGDVIPLHDDTFPKVITGAFSVLPWGVNHTAVYGNGDEVFFVTGNEWSWLSEESQHGVETRPFAIDSSSDRMAYSVRGGTLTFLKRKELLSSAVCAGTIQALPGGNLLILMADHQTTGGYPRIGHVATAHLPRVAQLNPGESLRFKKISVKESEKMLLSLGRDLRDIQMACAKKLAEYEANH